MTEPLLMWQPHAAREAWPLVRDRVAVMTAACHEAWMPEDVYAQLCAGNAYLWGTSDLSGFLVLQIAAQPYGRELHCWLCSNQSGEPPIAYWDQLLDIARDQNCVAVTFENDRPGFQRAIPGLRCRYAYRAAVT